MTKFLKSILDFFRNLHNHTFTQAQYVFMKIAEPRVTRILHFGIYLCMVSAGLGVLLSPPSSFKSVLGISLTILIGSFLLLGGVLGAIAVLPGIWVMERAGLFALMTGMCMYLVVLTVLRPSPVGYSITIGFVLVFLIRWFDIRGPQLAPREI